MHTTTVTKIVTTTTTTIFSAYPLFNLPGAATTPDLICPAPEPITVSVCPMPSFSGPAPAPAPASGNAIKIEGEQQNRAKMHTTTTTTVTKIVTITTTIFSAFPLFNLPGAATTPDLVCPAPEPITVSVCPVPSFSGPAATSASIPVLPPALAPAPASGTCPPVAGGGYTADDLAEAAEKVMRKVLVEFGGVEGLKGWLVEVLEKGVEGGMKGVKEAIEELGEKVEGVGVTIEGMGEKIEGVTGALGKPNWDAKGGFRLAIMGGILTLISVCFSFVFSWRQARAARQAMGDGGVV
ncbi:hypothetical protein QBC41DRAFT_297579 [Cercophora samala]|uniref:Uncharacterized protein n=1 Tax=Cercophora samala TaxID=330535 RepID=A0AA39ZNP1_9PEZI|nr:hypothetical protein QBC41DRAFT_297579 [Cercophora samala]